MSEINTVAIIALLLITILVLCISTLYLLFRVNREVYTLKRTFVKYLKGDCDLKLCLKDEGIDTDC